MPSLHQRLLPLWLVVIPGACASGSVGSQAAPAPSDGPAPMVQPGAPGQETRTIDSGDLDGMGGVAFTEADVRFMQGMIPHHAQALEMTALVRERTDTEAVRQMALRMEISQRDEIALMERWLRERDQPVPDWRSAMDRGTARAMTGEGDPAGGGGMGLMPGMLAPEEMDRLRGASREEFDRLFLRYMIRHHEGAIVMVRRLFSARGGGQESEIFQFASHVDADQAAEIRRMQYLLDQLR